MSIYLKIVFKNLEPVRVADDSTSQSGQTVTLRYIPGTALRGVVINTLAQDKDFEVIKKSLFSTNIRYLNAYLTDGDRELIPSPKGFYEDKMQCQGRKPLDNVVINGEFEEGKKRASLGRFSYMDKECIYYYNVDTGSDLKIKINDEKQNVFRHEYICSGYTFTGYIAVDDSALRDRIKRVFTESFVVGNGRSAGLGKCEVISCEYTDRLPYEEYLPDVQQENECYMMLLSNTVMRDANGELCGLDCDALAEKMGVTGLKIAFCATSTVDVKGYNRKWRTKLPSAVMYEQGSIFHLTYNGIFTREKMAALCDQVIGIRLNEGFGRIIFLNGYEDIRYKEMVRFDRQKDSDSVKSQYEEDGQTLKIAARCYYRNLLERHMKAYTVEHPLPKGKITNSQLGVLESYVIQYRYEPQKAYERIAYYFEHSLDKEEKYNVQKEMNSIHTLKKYVTTVFDTDLEALLSIDTKHKESIMGIPKDELITPNEKIRFRLELILMMIRYDNKKEEA